MTVHVHEPFGRGLHLAVRREPHRARLDRGNEHARAELARRAARKRRRVHVAPTDDHVVTDAQRVERLIAAARTVDRAVGRHAGRVVDREQAAGVVERNHVGGSRRLLRGRDVQLPGRVVAGPDDRDGRGGDERDHDRGADTAPHAHPVPRAGTRHDVVCVEARLHRTDRVVEQFNQACH